MVNVFVDLDIKEIYVKCKHVQMIALKMGSVIKVDVNVIKILSVLIVLKKSVLITVT
jgi:hypothetical protein